MQGRRRYGDDGRMRRALADGSENPSLPSLSACTALSLLFASAACSSAGGGSAGTGTTTASTSSEAGWRGRRRPEDPTLVGERKTDLGTRRPSDRLARMELGAMGTEQPGDAADNAKQGATTVRLPLRWWGDYPDGDDARNDNDPGHVDQKHLALLDQEIDDLAAEHVWVVAQTIRGCFGA
jgi:hypothetical protein